MYVVHKKGCLRKQSTLQSFANMRAIIARITKNTTTKSHVSVSEGCGVTVNLLQWFDARSVLHVGFWPQKLVVFIHIHI